MNELKKQLNRNKMSTPAIPVLQWPMSDMKEREKKGVSPLQPNAHYGSASPVGL